MGIIAISTRNSGPTRRRGEISQKWNEKSLSCTYCKVDQVSAKHLPFLRQVPSKAQWSGGAHRKHSKERKVRMFTHECPASHRLLTRSPTVGRAVAVSACVWLPSPETALRPPVPTTPPHPQCHRLPLRAVPVIVKSQLPSSSCRPITQRKSSSASH